MPPALEGGSGVGGNGATDLTVRMLQFFKRKDCANSHTCIAFRNLFLIRPKKTLTQKIINYVMKHG